MINVINRSFENLDKKLIVIHFNEKISEIGHSRVKIDFNRKYNGT